MVAVFGSVAIKACSPFSFTQAPQCGRCMVSTSMDAGVTSSNHILKTERSLASEMCHFLFQTHSVELERNCTERKKLERDLEEASCRLTMAHQEIRHLTDELDLARKGQHACGKCITSRYK